ncbi:hypothetical protein BvCmsOUP020_04784 [Escherichia coli]|nr:hypothetical protein BvCmsOUP020_04784 [Escherichia coli]
MFGIKEVLTVIAGRTDPVTQGSKDQLIRLYRRSAPHLLEQRGINTEVVVFEVIAANGDSAFKSFVHDGIAIGFHLLDDAGADPLTELRELPQPAVGVGFRCGGHGHRNFFILRRGHGHPGLKIRTVARHQGCDHRRCNRGRHYCISSFIFRNSASVLPSSLAAAISSADSAAVAVFLSGTVTVSV